MDRRGGGRVMPNIRTQFEGDALRNVQPVQFVVEDVHQTPVELPSTSDDSSGGVQDPLQLVSRSSRRVREQCVAVIYPTWTSVSALSWSSERPTRRS